MANMAASQVTRVRAWTEGGMALKDRKVLIVRLATSNDATGQGSATNAIPASLFGMTVIEECSKGVKSDNDLLLAAPSYSGDKLLLYNLNNATDANRSDPADFINTTFQITVRGY